MKLGILLMMMMTTKKSRESLPSSTTVPASRANIPAATPKQDKAKEGCFWVPRKAPSFNAMRAPTTPKAHELVESVIDQLESYEEIHALRTRRRRSEDDARFKMMVTAIVSDVCYHYSINTGLKISVSLSHQDIGANNRYAVNFIGKTFPRIIEYLSTPELAILVEEKGCHQANLQTTICAGKRLITLINKFRIDETDFKKLDIPELIMLNEKSDVDSKHKKLIDYEDTSETIRYRGEMQRINSWLNGADITFDFKACYPHTPVDPQERTLRRIFNNGSFTQGGRLYGGFWQPLHKKERAAGIRIEGEPTISLDYSQACPRILYGMAGAVPPLADIYDIQRLGREHRKGVKMVLNALLHSKKPLSQAPRGSRPYLPKRMKIAEIVRLIGQAHPAIVPYFFTGVGMELMFRESQILVRVLLQLMEMRIVALPVHDAISVRKDVAEEAMSVMVAVFKEQTGVEVYVSPE